MRAVCLSVVCRVSDRCCCAMPCRGLDISPIFLHRQITYGLGHFILKFLGKNPWGLACPGGAIGSVAVRAAWLRWPTSLGSRPRLAGLFVSCYSGVCFEIKFSGRHRGFDGVLFKLWPLANTGFRGAQSLVPTWTTDQSINQSINQSEED